MDFLPRAKLDDLCQGRHHLSPSRPTANHPQQGLSVHLSICSYEPYRDDVDEEDEEEEDNEDDVDDDTPASVNNAPPPYQPMYDYLRQCSISQCETFDSSYAYSLDSSCPPYSDRPFIVQISESESSTYFFDNLNMQQELTLGIFEDDHLTNQENDIGDSFETEDFVKWIVMMMIVCLTVASVGTAFDWGRP
ncbi:hypothetical protein K3495_g3988 [Podosphaera aphanis]|nr:hypothetical protein K3495_g3988 [Podosphaera aphanis]